MYQILFQMGRILASEITGYYFPDWENGYGAKLDSAHVK